MVVGLANHELIIHNRLRWLIDISHYLIVPVLLLDWHIEECIILTKHHSLSLWEHALAMVIRMWLLDGHTFLDLRIVALNWTYFICSVRDDIISNLRLRMWLFRVNWQNLAGGLDISLCSDLDNHLLVGALSDLLATLVKVCHCK